MVKLPEGVPGPAPDARPTGPDPRQLGIANVGVAEQAEVFSAQAGVNELADQLSKAGEKIWAREDDLKFLAASREFREKTDAETLKTLTSADLSKTDSVKKHNEAVTAIEDQTLGSFDGRAEARIKLAANLQQHRFSTIAQVAAASTKAQHDVVISEVKRYGNDLAGKLALGEIDYPQARDMVENFVNARQLQPHIKPSLISDVRGELAQQEIAHIIPMALADPVNGPAKLEGAIRLFAQAAPDMNETRRDNIVKLFESAANPPRLLTPAEVAAAGLPLGTVMEMRKDGRHSLYSPPAGKLERDQKIAQYVQIMESTRPDWSAEQKQAEAIGIVDNKIKYQIDNGQTIRINEFTGESTTAPNIPIQTPGTPAPQPKVNIGLYGTVARINDVAGAKGAAKDVLARTLGQPISEFVDKETEKVRTDAQFAQEALVRAIILSHEGSREGIEQVKHIEKLVDIAPSFWKSYDQLLTRMQQIDKNIRFAIEGEEAKLSSPGLSGKTLSQTRATIIAYKNFLRRLDYKEAVLPAGLPPGSTPTNKTFRGRKLFQTPQGKFWSE